jgi:hypothetical protein
MTVLAKTPMRHNDLGSWDAPGQVQQSPQVMARTTLNDVVRLRAKGTIPGPDADTLLRWAISAFAAASIASLLEDALKSGRRR